MSFKYLGHINVDEIILEEWIKKEEGPGQKLHALQVSKFWERDMQREYDKPIQRYQTLFMLIKQMNNVGFNNKGLELGNQSIGSTSSHFKITVVKYSIIALLLNLSPLIPIVYPNLTFLKTPITYLE